MRQFVLVLLMCWPSTSGAEEVDPCLARLAWTEDAAADARIALNDAAAERRTQKLAAKVPTVVPVRDGAPCEARLEAAKQQLAGDRELLARWEADAVRRHMAKLSRQPRDPLCAQECREIGACWLADSGVCAAYSQSACRASLACRLYGFCSLGVGVCEVLTDRDCKTSLGCTREGRCWAASGECIGP